MGKAKSPKNIFKIQAPNSGQVIVNINLNYNMNVKEEAKYSSVQSAQSPGTQSNRSNSHARKRLRGKPSDMMHYNNKLMKGKEIPFASSILRIKYNEIIGNVVSERKRLVN